MNFEISQSKQDLIIGLFEPVIDEIVARVSKIVLSTTNREPRYYSRKETADLLHVTLPTLAKLTKNGVVNCKRVCKRILYDARSIDDAIKQQTVFKYRRG